MLARVRWWKAGLGTRSTASLSPVGETQGPQASGELIWVEQEAHCALGVSGQWQWGGPGALGKATAVSVYLVLD